MNVEDYQHHSPGNAAIKLKVMQTQREIRFTKLPITQILSLNILDMIHIHNSEFNSGDSEVEHIIYGLKP